MVVAGLIEQLSLDVQRTARADCAYKILCCGDDDVLREHSRLGVHRYRLMEGCEGIKLALWIFHRLDPEIRTAAQFELDDLIAILLCARCVQVNMCCRVYFDK